VTSLVAFLPPPSLVIALPGPLDFNCDLARVILRKNVGPPLFTSWRYPGDLGVGCPSPATSCLDDYPFQFQMFFCFRASCAGPALHMAKKGVPRRDRFSISGELQHGVLRWRAFLFSRTRACHSSSEKSSE
jgi:hypothetical protein